VEKLGKAAEEILFLSTPLLICSLFLFPNKRHSERGSAVSA
jgi:hypothetical protein